MGGRPVPKFRGKVAVIAVFPKSKEKNFLLLRL